MQALRLQAIYFGILLILTTIIVLVVDRNLLRTKFIRIANESDELLFHLLENGYRLPDITDNPPNLEKRNIFFLETSCHSYEVGKIIINPRQVCAVESAARLNPEMNVYLLFSSPGLILNHGTRSDKLLEILVKYQNIQILHFDMARYVTGNWQSLFVEHKNTIEQNVEENSYLIHFWNKLSFKTPIKKINVNAPYLHFAMQYCPRIVNQIQEIF
ncbi:hypothetical protein ABEB36_014847 [Hypothenemus hampei]|uniref:Alpha 1,4-glycosyltransferase domain-containing protein n=1 Tax=Hypothenemus hampei TaxID=57062 RepID=A0ABD1E1C4_HYPHA